MDALTAANNVPAKILAIYSASEFHTSTAGLPPATPFGLVLSHTPFYAEAGGQEADKGRIIIDGGSEFVVSTVKSFSGFILHTGVLVPATSGQGMSVGEDVVASYDEVRRFMLFDSSFPVD